MSPTGPTAVRRVLRRDSDRVSTDEPAFVRRIPRIGIWAWSFVGFVIVAIIVVFALAAVSEIALPMTFAAVLAVIFKPLVGALERHKLKPTLAAGLIVLGLLALMAGVAVATVRGVTEQADEISTSVDKALDKAADETDALGIDQDSLDEGTQGRRGRRSDDHHRRPVGPGLGHRRARRDRRAA